MVVDEKPHVLFFQGSAQRGRFLKRSGKGAYLLQDLGCLAVKRPCRVVENLKKSALKKFLAPQGGSESFPEVQPDHGKTLCTARFPGNTILGYAFPAS